MESPPATSQPHELSRLAALLRYEILDTPEEAAFDDFTELAARLCGTPIALISLVDERRQWFKSRVGLAVSETPREISFCTHAIRGEGLFEVVDASQDPRFRQSPLVTGEPHIRFYAGMPLTSPDGYNLGTLCVIDRQPRQLTSEQRDTLERLARQVIRLFEQRLLAHRHAEQAALQQAILDSASSAVLVTRPDGIVSSVNPTAERLLGYSEQELLGHPLTSALFQSKALQRRAAILSSELETTVEAGFAVLVAPLHQGRREMSEWRLRHRNGGEVPVLLGVTAIRDEQERLRGYLVNAYDLAYQEQLQLRLQQIAAQVPGMLFQFHWRPDGVGCFPYVSEGIEQTYGLSPAQLASSFAPIYARVHAPDRTQLLAGIRQAAASLTPWHSQHRVEHPRKGLIWVEAHATPLRQPDGSILWHGFVADITERKRIERLQREFISTVSHELRTPLTSIGGALTLICSEVMGEVPAQMRELLEIAHQNSQRLGALIDDLLDMDKLHAGQMRFDLLRQPLRPLLEQALRSNQSYAGQHGVRLQLGECPPLQVEVDAMRLHQVLSNLLANAAKFSPPGERVDLFAERGDAWVRVSVRDRGPGITADFHERVFHKFAQADSSDSRQQGGTGLGLAISKELIERMGGRIGFDSEPGQGACFWFELPCSERPVAASESQP